jgi:hypothetical protein
MEILDGDLIKVIVKILFIMETNRIVTFSCSNKIHIYERGCGKLPNPPYKKHDNIDSAVFYMSQVLGVNDIEIVIEKKLKRESDEIN